ncbi:mechanosensitive ion channel [Roseibacillus ishigakijimensis]|uniref:Mechanosensitive ion channel n=1 Tax=Roseibacillus ishigakijimensis TaxID=454146 RepID=A0A934RMC3_9BACT|nr:mechanosensitive ion channel [Roseibacillus ishigakijimensis]MBK1834029.1 mechanosensitive ion channel [Roseibacillus ishigakijimensis]
MKPPLFYALLFLFSSLLPMAGQESVPAPSADSQATEKVKAPNGFDSLLSVLSSYRTLREQQVTLREQVRELTAAGATAEGEPGAEALAKAQAELTRNTESIARLKERIEELALGSRYQESGEGEEASYDFNEEIQMLLQPSLEELREVTEPTRKLARLRTEVLDLQNKEEDLELALGKLQKAIEATDSSELKNDSEIKDLFESLQIELESQLSLCRADLATAKTRLDEMQAERKPIPQQVQDSLSSFFAGRGRSLLLAALASLAVFYLLTYLHRLLFKRLGRSHEAGTSFAFRLAELGFTALRFLAAIAAVFFVFLAFNDWLLVTLTILVFLAVLWGTKEAILKGYHKMQLLLNLGPVRQGERVLYNGLPYRVRSLSVYPLIENPALSNSTVRLTIEELGEMRMRHDDDEEPWFITEVGDYVLLSDGTYGQVAFQSPDRVKIQEAGGQSKVIPTSDFLSMAPTNLSKGYAVAITFGIDYAHQQLDYNAVAEIFAANARRKVEEFLPAEQILATFSAFKEAGASSLDYLVVVKVTGEAQDKRPNLLRALSQGCLDACNEYGWGIPFPQMTIHRAGD